MAADTKMATDTKMADDNKMAAIAKMAADSQDGGHRSDFYLFHAAVPGQTKKGRPQSE